MTIAIDIDRTWTAAPWLFRILIREAKKNNINCIYATGRTGWTPDLERMNLAKIPIVFCGQERKRSACERHGYKVDIWIDDMPAMIDHGLDLSPTNDDEL